MLVRTGERGARRPRTSFASAAQQRRYRYTVRTGFGAMVVLLVLSAAGAYRAESDIAHQTETIYRRHVRELDILFNFRRTLYLASLGVRDFFLAPQSDETRFREQLRIWQGEAEAAAGELERLDPTSQHPARLRELSRDYWSTLGSATAWTSEKRRSRAFEFVQQEVTPRRNAAGDLLREWAAASQTSLEDAGRDFAESRRTVARRLSIVLGLCLACGLVAAYASLAYSERLERERQWHYQQAEESRAQLERLSARLVEAQEAERKRLSRELHDEIGQALAALGLEIAQARRLNGAGNLAVEERLGRAREVVERILQTVRHVALLLRPAMLDDLGLAAALEWQAEEFERRTGVACLVQTAGITGDLPETHKICVYRLVQEALHNCERHAAASRVRILVRQAADGLEAEVEDDGRGFVESAPRNTGLGLLGMGERAAMLGGDLEVDTAPGRGTRLRLRLPGGAIEPPAAAPVEARV